MDCADVYNLFFNEGEVTEIRAYGLSRQSKAWEGWAGGAGIVYGYFDNADDFGKCAEALEATKAPGIYFVLNPVQPDLLARAANRLKAADQKTVTTSDKDVVCLRWLYIDLDPKRPTGISSNQAELDAAITLRNEIYKWARQEWGITEMIPAMSGNGAHLMVRLPDLAPTDDNAQVLRSALLALDAKFSTDVVDVDKSVFNPSRICKLYGTTARKGDHIKIRPHRKSYIEPKFIEKKSPAQEDRTDQTGAEKE
jgi:hypothetical protein